MIRHLTVLTLAATLLPGAALAQSAAAPAAAQSQPAPAPAPVILPPGPGMVESPCPKLPEPLTDAGWSALGAYNRKYDWPWLCRYRTENAALKTRPSVVFLGDSITENWGRLDPALFSGGIVDRGISGQTTPQMVLRFRQDVIALRPKVVHIMAGTNDIAGNTGPASPEQFQDNIRTMVDLAQANRIKVVLGAIPPAARFGWVPAVQSAQWIAQLNGWLKSFAAARRLGFADYHAALAGPDGGMKPGTSTDGVHPNAEGYSLMRPVAELALVAAGVRPAAPPKR